MSKFILIFFLAIIFFACDSNSKNSSNTNEEIWYKREYDWSKIETNYSRTKKREVLKNTTDDVIQAYDKMVEETGNDELYDRFHVIDINNDNQPDMIYNGFDGGPAHKLVVILINKDKHFIKDYQGWGNIYDVVNKNKKVVLQIWRPLFNHEATADTLYSYSFKN